MKRRLAPLRHAPHPFRQSLALARAEQADPEDQDIKLFVLSFTAFFICFYTFIF